MRRNYNGFTLIELLFVIAIIGVLASLGVSMAEKKAEEFKVKKAALQLQYVLEAGLSYYADNKNWPMGAWVSADGKGTPGINVCGYTDDTGLINFCQNYIGVALKDDPWGSQPYSWWPTKSLDGTKFYRFSAIVKTPNLQIAQRVAALMPNAEYCSLTRKDPNWDAVWKCSADVPDDQNMTYIRAYVNAPGQVSSSMDIDVIGVAEAHLSSDDVRNKKLSTCNEIDVPIVNCSSDKRADIFVAIQHLSGAFNIDAPTPDTGAWVKFQNDTNYTDDTAKNIYDQKDGMATPRCKITSDNKNYDCKFKLCIRLPKKSGRQAYKQVTALYFTACIPK